jgi:hypothetical protein
VAHRPIGHLKTRDKVLTIRTGPDGPLYTVKSADGNVLAAGLSPTDLSTRFPELKDMVERGIADWAGIDPKYQPLQGDSDGTFIRTDVPKTVIIEHNK